MKTLKDLFISELCDIYDAEHRLTKALPRMAQAATCSQLSDLIHSHLKETEGHVAKLERVFACFDCKPKRITCEATVGLIAEAEQVATDFKDSPVINAALIAAAQKVEHYEVASYGCLHEWASLLDNAKAAGILAMILNDEKNANEALTELARTTCNPEAACDSPPAESAGAEMKEAQPVREFALA